ncbi:hypothetical protein Hypma_004052 [Hypsizygus marmoreus]|uniref:Uncharacterized protein n=1 Tax=Hypsizygus marmoreus TaxID=39966 RepID=A0A369J4Q2_HYPMA|nr:hypothetical protein Hypma_004052 [Hypsizygus marmoreus]
MALLQRLQSTFVYPWGAKRTLSIVSTERDMGETRSSRSGSLPPQVILTYGTVMRAYGRKRLMYLDFDAVLDTFEHDFGIVRSPTSQSCLLDEGFSVTFYRTHGHGDSAVMLTIDPTSWHELLRNVTRIDFGRRQKMPWWKKVGMIIARFEPFLPRVYEALKALAHWYWNPLEREMNILRTD